MTKTSGEREINMDTVWKNLIWQQFGASIDMLENAIVACPDEIWNDRSEEPEYWYLAFHTLFWLDLYLSGAVENFAPLRTFLRHCRRKCRTTIENSTDEEMNRLCRFGWGEASFAELLLYNMRHVQHHAAQLNLILRQKTDSAPGWVAKARISPANE
jgi:hypothetical protein